MDGFFRKHGGSQRCKIADMLLFFCGKNGVSSPAVQSSWVGNPAHGTPCAPRVRIIALEFMIL